MANADEIGKGTAALPRGAYARIARRLRPRVSPNHVREVALGKRPSARVERAIAKYRQSLEQKPADYDDYRLSQEISGRASRDLMTHTAKAS